MHGVWDAASKYVGPYIAPHTNITEIDAALDLLWRAGVSSSKVVLGQGWYGRSFTLTDPTCNKPNGICRFSGGATAGPCSKASGILDYQEISDIIKSTGAVPVWDKPAGIKYITWNSNQWVSYDDGDTFKQKRDFANSRCLGGLMVWATDQVSQTASNGFGGSAAAAGAVVSTSQQASADQSSADHVAGLTCYVADCGQNCKPGTGEVTQFNGQPGSLSTSDKCAKKSYRSLCCDSKTTVGTCQWRGYRGAGIACIGGCASGETELTTNTNSHLPKGGDKNCHGGTQSYCCANFKPTSECSLLSVHAWCQLNFSLELFQESLDVHKTNADVTMVSSFQPDRRSRGCSKSSSRSSRRASSSRHCSQSILPHCRSRIACSARASRGPYPHFRRDCRPG